MPESEQTLLINNANQVVTMNSEKEVLESASIFVVGNLIVEVGSDRTEADVVIDATDKIVMPGFINTHHHLFQAFMRHVPEMQNQRIDKWIAKVSELAIVMEPEAHYWAAMANMAELMFSGCTTTTDMLYLFPKQQSHLDLFAATVKASRDLGLRFHPFRGSMSLSQKDGAEFPDEVVESSKQILKRTAEVIEKYHQQDPTAMIKVGIAPCTIFTSSEFDFREAARLAQEYDVNLQTHLSESRYEQEYASEHFNKTPLEYLQSLGWDDERVSFAHCVEVGDQDIEALKRHSNSVCHCPISNARSPIGQKGIAPISEMLDVGVNVAIGVDGSAGNDSSNMLEDMRWARTLQGAREGSTYLDPRDVLTMGTVGGARALRWEEAIGSIEVGKCADLAIFDLSESIAHLGVWNVIGSSISCQAIRVDTLVVNGEIRVNDGELSSVDEREIVQKAREKWKGIYGGTYAK